MNALLLDVNVLIAMVWHQHDHYDLVRDWLGKRRGETWATCPITESGFVRVSALPRLGGVSQGVQRGLLALQKNRAEPDHVFWPHETSVVDLNPEIKARVRGHQQVTDAILLDLAIRNGGHLVTLDRRIRHLLPADSPHQASIEVIPTIWNVTAPPSPAVADPA